MKIRIVARIAFIWYWLTTSIPAMSVSRCVSNRYSAGCISEMKDAKSYETQNPVTKPIDSEVRYVSWFIVFAESFIIVISMFLLFRHGEVGFFTLGRPKARWKKWLIITTQMIGMKSLKLAMYRKTRLKFSSLSSRKPILCFGSLFLPVLNIKRFHLQMLDIAISRVILHHFISGLVLSVVYLYVKVIVIHIWPIASYFPLWQSWR